VKISSEYAGSLDKNGSFAREIRMSEVFYSHLIEHAVPLNEVAIRELKGTPTALDLYTYLAYRLPRIGSDKGQVISWDQLAKHLGNDADTKRFRQTVRETMQLVSAVYPNANVDLSGRKVVLHPSPAPMERKLVGPHLRLVAAQTATAPRSSVPTRPSRKRETHNTAEPLLAFPQGSLSFGSREMAFRKIGLDKGHPWSVDDMADAFRKGCPAFDRPRSEAEWLRIWEAFVVKYAERRATQGPMDR
jgi:hypothetical protein